MRCTSAVGSVAAVVKCVVHLLLVVLQLLSMCCTSAVAAVVNVAPDIYHFVGQIDIEPVMLPLYKPVVKQCCYTPFHFTLYCGHGKGSSKRC